jgi:5-methylcytosine-specific restriction endonuclease McrA
MTERQTRRRELVRIQKEIIDAAKTECFSCGLTDFDKLTFHHKNPKEKKFTISGVKTGKTITQIKDEISKCVILCVDCHREYEAGRLVINGLSPPWKFLP